jgi:hypothetical protein
MALIVVQSGITGAEEVQRNFLPSDFGDVLANLTTTSRAMDKWMLRLDSAGQKDPEITLKGVLIVVESWYTTGKNRLAFLRTPVIMEKRCHISFDNRSCMVSPIDSHLENISKLNSTSRN